MKLLLLGVVLTIFFSTSAVGVYYSEVDEIIAGNFNGYGARQMAMGGAGIMSIDGAALYYNPANLARIPRIELSLGFTFAEFDAAASVFPAGQTDGFLTEENKKSTKLNQALLTIPYPTYRGSLVFGLGMVRSSDFDRASTVYYEQSELTDTYSVPESIYESGGINLWAFGFGIDLSPRLSVGATAILYYGKHDLVLESNLFLNSYIYQEFEQELNYRYISFGGKLGAAYQLSRNIGFGITAELPIRLDVQQDATIFEDGEVYPGYSEYNLKRPAILSGGIIARFNKLNFLADVKYVDWTEMAYGDNQDFEIEYNTDFLFFYREVISMRLGAEYALYKYGLTLRAGYFNDPLPYDDIYISEDRQGVTFGIGILIDRIMTLDIAYVMSSHTNRAILEPADGETVFIQDYDLIDEVKLNKIYITGAYRF